MSHAGNPDLLRRLKQAQGHLASIHSMVEEGRSCLDLVQQLQAVEATVHGLKRSLIQHHIGHCIEDAAAEAHISQDSPALRELKALAKYL